VIPSPLQRIRERQKAHKQRGLTIANGSQASLHDFPFIVSLQYRSSTTATTSEHFCGGSIIDRYVRWHQHV